MLNKSQLLNAIATCQDMPCLDALMCEYRAEKEYVPVEVRKAWKDKEAFLIGDGQTGEVSEDGPEWL